MGLYLLAYIQLPTLKRGVEGIAGVGVSADARQFHEPPQIIAALWCGEGRFDELPDPGLPASFAEFLASSPFLFSPLIHATLPLS